MRSLAQDSSFVLKGVLLDSLFITSDSLTVEVLENGQKFSVIYGNEFTIPLPYNDSWNLCVKSDSIEQCYEIVKGTPYDSTGSFADSLKNENRLQVFSSFIEKKSNETVAPVLDSVLITDEKSVPEEEQVNLLTRLRPVVIQVRKRPKRRIGQSTVSSKAIERQPGLAEADVIKAIQALPGVVASSDFSSKIYVRGGGADQNLFLFDNGVVYSPVHFFGLFSTFLVDGVESVDFYKGGFSPLYGNRLSSVVAIQSRKGGVENNDSLKLKAAVQITTFAATLTAEASKKNTRINVSGRSTYIKQVLTALRKIRLTDLDIDYGFYDIQGNIFHKINERQGVTLSLYTGRDNLLFIPLKTFWGNTVVPLNYYWNISNNLDFKASLSYSKFNQEFGIEKLQTFFNEITSISLQGHIDYRGLDNHLLTTGFESQFFKTTFGNKADYIDVDVTSVDRFTLHSIFTEDKIEMGKFNFAPGVRANYITSINTFSAEPRISISFSLNDKQNLQFHTGYYKQFINSVIFGDFESLNEFYYPATKEESQTIPPASSLLFSLGYSYDKVFNKYDFIWEAYYKTLDDLIVFDPNSKPDSIRNNPQVGLGDLFIRGEGYSLGTELSLRKNEGLVTGGISYAFGYSVQKELDRVFRAKWEIPHSLKIDGGIIWFDPDTKECVWKNKKNRKKRYLRSSFQVKYTSGLPLTEISGYLPTHYIDQGEGQQAGGPTPDLDENLATPLGGRNKNRYPSYSRFDIKLIDWGRKDDWNFSWTFLNIFNKENVFLYTYDNAVRPPERSTVPQFPFFPILFSYKKMF